MKTSILILLFFGITVFAPAQSWMISGTVSDEQGNALPGATVVVENTKRGTATDMNGFYQIKVNATDSHLLFSCIGYKTKKIKIGVKKNIHVVLKTEIVSLNEGIVIVGYESEDASSPTVFGKKSSMVHRLQIGGVMPPVNWNTENYSTIHENGFKGVLNNPLSTFSIDVDNASYSNVRRFLNQGDMPPVDAVRIEEMINYFNYDYPEPIGEHPFSVYTEVSGCPWNSEHQLLHIGLKGKSIDKTELPASNLVFLLDVSGSMQDYNKLPLVKKAFRLLVNELRPIDRVAIVVYAGAAGKVLDSTPGSSKREILDAIEKLHAGGSTAGGEGLRLAYKIAHENFIEGGNNRIILATDGDFNVGVSSTSEMERLVEKERENGIFMTVLGFGTGNIKDDKMETIADKGNGNYAYIDNIHEARKVLINEFGGTLFTIAKDVKFQLEFNPQKVKSYRLVGYENRLLNDEDFNDDTKDAGEIGAGHTVTALYELIPADSNEETASVDPLKYQSQNNINEDFANEMLTVKLRYKQPDGNKSRLIEKAVSGKPLKMKNTSDNFRFSAAVASFGMLLRNSDFKGNVSVDQIVELAGSSKGEDKEGYRSEFIKLVKSSENLKAFSEIE